jgi:hypothetical protein
VKHAGEGALERLVKLIGVLRQVPGLKEKKPGTFYKGSAAHLHFHEDPAGLFADLKVNGEWQRFAVNTLAERKALAAAAQTQASAQAQTKMTPSASSAGSHLI